MAMHDFARNNIQLDTAGNVLAGSTIDIDPDMCKQRGCRSSYRTQPLRNLRDSAKGGCFVIASGPSINDIDFNLLKGQVLFGVNGSPAVRHRFPAAFSHYIVTDSSVAYDQFPLLAEMISTHVPCFFSRAAVTLICALRPDLLDHENIYLIEPTPLSQSELESDNDFVLGQNKTGFSKNLEKGYLGAGTVVFPALQACKYLGYDRVYMMGVDLFAVPGKHRFYDDAEDARFAKQYAAALENMTKDRILPAFESVGSLNNDPNEDFRIFNLSAKSRIPVELVPKLTLDEALRLEKQAQ